MSTADEIRSLLMDVILNGAVIVPKRKLLWLLGWGQDREGAWKGLLDHWTELGQVRTALHGLEVYDKIVLTMPVVHDGDYVPVETWAPDEE